MFKVLALDLDGTVLSDAHKIHPEVKRVIKNAQKYWHVVLVTGRHHTAAKPYHHELGLSTPILCCNGTYIYDYRRNQVVDHNAIEKQTALTFIEIAKINQLKTVLYATDSMFYAKNDPSDYILALVDWAKAIKGTQSPNIYPSNSFVQEIEDTQHVWKFVVEGESDAIELLLDEPWIKANFNAERSWSNRIDFAAKGNNKGTSLAQYVKGLGYEASQVIAVGDNHNDISMLKYAACGVAMNNADDIVKDNANLVCSTDSNHDGLASLLRGLLAH